MSNPSKYPGYEIPKEEIINFLSMEEVKLGVSAAMKQLAEGESLDFSDYPSMVEILDKISLDQLKYYISDEAIKRYAARKGDSAPGGYYSMGSLIEDEENQESFMSPDSIFITEPKVDESVIRGVDKDWYADEEIYHPNRAFGYKQAGFAEKIPHETMHTYIEGKEQMSHYGHGLSQGKYEIAIGENVLPSITGKSWPSILYPKTGDKGTASWQELEDLYYGYKDWKLKRQGLSEKRMESSD